MRASSTLSLDDGISTVSWAAWMPLRMRVRKSAMGSVIDIRSPARLRHARDHPVVRELPEADPAQAELPVDGTRAAAPAAPGVFAGLVLGGALLAHPLGGLRHGGRQLLRGDGFVVEGLEAGRTAFAGERHAERVQQGERLRVGLRGRRERHVETAHLVDLVVIDLREDDLLADAHGVIAAAVEGARVQAPEVADPGDRDGGEP